MTSRGRSSGPGIVATCEAYTPMTPGDAEVVRALGPNFEPLDPAPHVRVLAPGAASVGARR